MKEISFSQLIRIVWSFSEVRKCSLLLVPFLLYLICYQLWKELPELFPGAGIVDEILNIISAGYLSSFVFYIVIVAFPKADRLSKSIAEARSHILYLQSNVDSLMKAVDVDVNDCVDTSFMAKYIDDSLHNKLCVVYFSHHLGGCEGNPAPVWQHIKQLALRAEYTCRVFERLLPLDYTDMFNELEAVDFRAHCVLKNEYTWLAFDKGRSAESTAYPALIIAIIQLVVRFEKEYGLE